jgi:hypothetical protein
MTRATKITVYVVLGVIAIVLLVLLLNVAVGYEGGAREVAAASAARGARLRSSSGSRPREQTPHNGCDDKYSLAGPALPRLRARSFCSRATRPPAGRSSTGESRRGTRASSRPAP